MFSFTYVNPHYDIRKVVLIVDSENTAVLIQQSVKLLWKNLNKEIPARFL